MFSDYLQFLNAEERARIMTNALSKDENMDYSDGGYYFNDYESMGVTPQTGKMLHRIFPGYGF